MAETPLSPQPQPKQDQSIQESPKPVRIRPVMLRALLFLNGLAAVALALSFQASSSGLKIVSQEPTWSQPVATVYYCLGDTTIFKTDANGNITTGVSPCPSGAKFAAVITSDYPIVFKIALFVMAVSSMIQVLMVRNTD
jgi:hypothetical protein